MRFAPYNEHTINPLFWQHADDREAIAEEMRRMKSVGINDCILESRPHPDWLGEGWWSDLEYILGVAEELDMLIWIFDDGAYPSGTANGKLAEKYPELTKRFLAEHHMDAHGPLPHAHFLIDNWLEEGEVLHRVIAARRTPERQQTLDSDTLVDLTHLVSRGRLYWAVPEGDWRIFVIKITRRGMEDWTNNYANPISHAAVAKYIEMVHEEHYARFKQHFGKRIAGFFTDEPRLGNIPGYDRIIGSCNMPLPCSPELLEALERSPLGSAGRLLPLLWHPDAQGLCADMRYVYMDAVSRLFGECFTGQLGDWCRARGVKYIGHVVEENGAHSRLGYGAGHFFRAIRGLDAAGIDIVDNLMPEQTDGSYITLFNNYDCDFNHWGIAKMASSAAHADPRKGGATFCEAFGAYGWFEGLRLMKWITDHLAVQGINNITPHAFSPAPFPDPDCPPHFYARGENPQFRLFHVWSHYACRLMGALAGARHIAPAAVVYHAEAEWGGEAEPFEKAVKALARRQIDCDVVCIDDLLTARVENGCLVTATERFAVLVVPYARYIPGAFAEKLRGFAAAGLPVYFTKALPERCYFGGRADIPGAQAVETAALPDVLAAYADIRLHTEEPDVQYAHYRKDGMDLYLFVNQSTQRDADTAVSFADTRPAAVYDPMKNTSVCAAQTAEDGGCTVRLQLPAWGSLMVVFGADTEGLAAWQPQPEYELLQVFTDGWRISTASSKSWPAFEETSFTCVGDLSLPEYLPDFSGTVRYERSFTLKKAEELVLELGDAHEAVTVSVNGECIAELICPPYRVTLPAGVLHTGENTLSVEVINTLVKAQHKNPFDRFFVQEPTGLVTPVCLLRVR